jgi:hypothetical protein
MRSRVHILIAIFLSAAWLLGLPVASAQSTAPKSAAPKAAAPKAEAPNAEEVSPGTAIPDEKLDAAAAVMGRVALMLNQYEQQLATASPEEKKRIAGEANDALTKAVTDQGLTIDEYNKIIEVAQADPQTRNRLVERLRASPKQ